MVLPHFSCFFDLIVCIAINGRTRRNKDWAPGLECGFLG